MLTLEQTEKIVAKFPNMFWDGWDVVIVNPKVNGYSAISGIFFKGTWCVKKVHKMNSEGKFELPPRYTAKYS